MADLPLPSPLEHELLRELAIARFGVDVPPRRRAALAGALWPRLRARGLTGFAAYGRLLRGDGATADDWGDFADAVTNHETFLFRGRGQLDDLVELLPTVAPADRPLRVLSAGCSSGEEPYSLAAVLAGQADRLPHGFEVIGVDVSTPRLAEARAGRFTARSLRPDAALPRGVRLDGGFVFRDGAWVARDELRARVRFVAGNLADPAGLGLGRFDVVFCRNVLIYAHASGWPRFLRSLTEALAPTGALFLGESETLLGRGGALQPRRLTRHFVYTPACRSE